ncbi:Acetyl esterase/lipase [Parafrankia irregularis]|uniref:Acetyl esterase/lipase n=1 Tax=Parafrankia irregularis TaxID=795642 RepID=A0A0S4QWD0_9ACTN|nr:MULTISPECIES: alpha/beta hydrolase [Parafrankia]MBE3201540.1 alpha/beta hydrolase [Parafrankia sp. CH37]CUU59390.1 Acetyl esterase/lipase [Parafrankia irregularis]
MSDQPGAHVPTSVSEVARQFLAAPASDRATYPALTDAPAWSRLIDITNSALRERFSGFDFPVEVQDTKIAGVRTFVLNLRGMSTEKTPIYLDLHGGALIAGGGELCRLISSATAMINGMITWGVDYRMPPSHPYPAALDDCVAVYRALLEEREPSDIFVGGGSAGGNLAAALLVRAKEEGLPMPAALVLLSPEADLTESGDSFFTNRLFDNVLGSLHDVNLLYADGHDLSDPHLSPLFADLVGFPPTFLQSGTRDLFLSNTVRMHRRLRSAGVEAELHVFEAMPHGGFGGTSPEDLEMCAEMRRFLDRHRRKG